VLASHQALAEWLSFWSWFRWLVSACFGRTRRLDEVDPKASLGSRNEVALQTGTSLNLQFTFCTSSQHSSFKMIQELGHSFGVLEGSRNLGRTSGMLEDSKMWSACLDCSRI
jgi:hypothetical protein